MSMTEPTTAEEVRQRIREVRARRAGQQFYERPHRPVMEVMLAEEAAPIKQLKLANRHDVLLVATPGRGTALARYCIDYIANHYAVAAKDVISHKRTAPIVRVRQIAIYVIQRLTKQSLGRIGQTFGGRDHSTIFHSVHKVADLIEKNSAVRSEIEFLIEVIGQEIKGIQ